MGCPRVSFSLPQLKFYSNGSFAIRFDENEVDPEPAKGAWLTLRNTFSNFTQCIE
jgi:hypothetical protein